MIYENFKIMIGFSTEQNTTNLIPAIQLGVRRFICIETTQAQRQGWSLGLAEVLKRKQIETEKIELSKDEDNHIAKIAQKAEKHIAAFDSVVWNLGGGQKPHALALWTVFRKRIEQGKNDTACYTNPGSKKMEYWKFDGQGALELQESETDVELSAEDILEVFGYAVKGSAPLLYKKSNAERQANDSIKDFLPIKPFRELLFRVAAQNSPVSEDAKLSLNEVKGRLKAEKSRWINDTLLGELEAWIKNLQARNTLNAFLENKGDVRKNALNTWINCILNKINELAEPQKTKEGALVRFGEKERALLGETEERLPASANTVKRWLPEFDKTANYFEKIVVQRIQNLLLNTEHNVTEAYSNLEIVRSNNRAEIAAEYDVLCVTKYGTLLAFDAKSFDFERKDNDARLYNLSEAGGKYVRFFPVIPFDPEDLNEAYFPEKLKDLPQRLKDRKMQFFVVADSRQSPFNVERQGGNLSVQAASDAGVECKLLTGEAFK